jgi:hypothetical protein
MPVKTGLSHALAAFVSLVVGTMLSKYVWTYTPSLATAGRTVGTYVTALSGVPLSREAAGGLVVVVLLSFLWGVAYHVGRHGR